MVLGLVTIINNQDLMLCAGLFVNLLLVIQSSSPSSSNNQKSAQELDSLLAPAEMYVQQKALPCLLATRLAHRQACLVYTWIQKIARSCQAVKSRGYHTGLLQSMFAACIKTHVNGCHLRALFFVLWHSGLALVANFTGFLGLCQRL